MYIFTSELELEINQSVNDQFLNEDNYELLNTHFQAENIWYEALNLNLQRGTYKFKFYYPTFMNIPGLVLQVVNKSISDLHDQIYFQKISFTKPKCVGVTEKEFKQKIKQHGFRTKMECYVAKLN